MTKASKRALELDKMATEGPWEAMDEIVGMGDGMMLYCADNAEAQFIAESRTLLPELAHDVEELEEENSDVKKHSIAMEKLNVQFIHEKLKLARQVDRLTEALEALLDEQNGPPLLRHKDSWQAAVDKARQALQEKEDERIP